MKDHVNLNTVLLSVLIGLIAWNGNRIVNQVEKQNDSIKSLEIRITKLEAVVR